MRLETTAQADAQTGFTLQEIYRSPKVELLSEFHWNYFPYGLHFRPMLFIVNYASFAFSLQEFNLRNVIPFCTLHTRAKYFCC